MSKIMKTRSGPSNRPQPNSRPSPGRPIPSNDNVPKPANDNRLPSAPRAQVPRPMRLGVNPLLGWAIGKYFERLYAPFRRAVEDPAWVPRGPIKPIGYTLAQNCQAPTTGFNNYAGNGSCLWIASSLLPAQLTARYNSALVTGRPPSLRNNAVSEGQRTGTIRSYDSLAQRWTRVQTDGLPAKAFNPTQVPKHVPVLPPWMDPLVPPNVPVPTPRPAPYNVVPYLPTADPTGKPRADNGPKPTNIINPRTLPKPREREVKLKSRIPRALLGLQKVYHEYTEAVDVIDALYEAINATSRKQWEKKKKAALKELGLKQVINPVDKLGFMYDHLDQINWDQAIKNILKNQIEDAVVGNANNYAKRWADQNGITLGPGTTSRNWGGRGNDAAPPSPVDKIFEALEEYDF